MLPLNHAHSRYWIPKRAEGNFGIFSYLESSTNILYDIKELKLFSAFCVLIDKEQLDKLEFDGGVENE